MRIKYFFAFFIVASAFLLSPCQLRAQNGAEEPVVKQANTYFLNGDFPAAMPLYSQLLSNHKEDANYNYRYGVCVLFASTEKDKGLKFLEKASQSPDVEADVWFYLGKAYHLNYQFEQAITSYNKFKTLAGPKKAEKMQVDNQIAMCKTGRKLLKAITDITVLDKAELNEADFFRRYDLRGAGYSGQLLVKPDEFKTSLDKKKNEQSIIFLSGEKTELYFASYGEDESQGKDIYVVRKLPNGNWGKPQNVGYPINTEYDEDFPFLHPNGKVLYFSSKGHSSMGGYDIFRAEINEDVGTWQKPVNLDFAINSPDDDIMFISDLDEKTAWFASNRSSPEGRMTVYHVVIERKPVNMCLIAGTFTPTPGDPNRSAKITVKNAETNEPLGVYKSNEATGKYLINLPNNGGKYTFTVDHSGIATQTENVFVPPQYQIKTLNQQVGYNDINNESKLFITTDFDADTSMLDPTFLKDKAKLDIYNGEPTATQITDIGQLPGTLPEAGGVDSGDGNDTGDDSVDTGSEPQGNPPTKVQNEELVRSANEDAASTQQEAIDLGSQKEKAWTNATQINQQAKAKTAEAKAAKEKADALPEGPEKIAAQKEADKLTGEANALQSQAAAAISIAQALDNDAKQKQQEADKAKQYAASLEKAVKNNDSKALDAAIAQGSELQAMSDTRAESAQTAKNLQAEADKKQAELDKAKGIAQDLREEIAQNEERIKQLRVEQAKEKDPDLRAGIDSQIEGINEDIDDNKKELAAADKKVALLQNQANDLDNQAKGANDAIAQSKSPAVTGSVISADDKKAMAADAIAYQQSISESGTSRVFAPVGTQTSGSEPTGTQTAGTQPVGTQTSGTEPTGTQTSGTQTSGTQPVGTQTSGTEPTGTQTTGTQPGDDSDNVVVAETVDPSIAFTESIRKTDSITDPVAREKAKAAVYSEWAANLDDQIKEKRQELAGTTDKTKKAQINSDIKALQTAKTQKEKDAKASLAAADKEQKAQIASRPSQPAVSSEQFTTQLNDADAKPSVAEKENTKAQIYSDWADSLDAAATVKENGLPKIKDKKQQEKVKQEIVALRAEAETKRGLADDAKSKAVAAEASTQPVATTATTKVNYDNPEAAAALKEQDNLIAQAEQNKANRDSLANLAAAATGDQKTKLLTAASDQQREAWDKEAAASAKLGEADKKQFEKNDQSLKRLDAAAISSTDPNASVAALLSAEARALFEKAQQERDSANATTNNFIKREALQRAEEDELKGLQKQQEALALYEKSGVQPIASGMQPVGSQQSAVGSQSTGSEPTGTQTSGTQPVGTQTSGTQPVGTQTSGSEPIGTQTSGTQPVGTQTSGSEPTGTQTAGTQTTGSEPTGTQTSGTQPVGTQTTGSEPTGTQTSGTQPVGTQITGSEPTASQTQIIDPSTGQPLSSIQVNEIRGSDAYRNYVTANKEAIKSDNEVAAYKVQADEFQASADSNVAKAQDFTVKAADEKNRTKKQEYIDESKKYNELAAQNMASRDSINELADAAATNANANRNNSRNILQALEPKTAGQLKAIATAEQSGNPLVVRTGTEPVGSQQSAVGSQSTGSEPTGTQTSGTQPVGTQTTGSEPTGTQTSGTEPVGSQQSAVGSQSTGSEPTGTQTSGTQPVGTQTSGSEPTGTQTSGTQPVGTQTTGSEPTGTQTSGVGTQTSGSEPTGTQTTGTQPTGTQNPSSVTNRLAPGEDLKLAPPTATATTPTIAVNPSLPEGLVYKVQIGAFRNPISAAIYKGISPVTAETTASGLTRYTAGIFKQFANADAAKVEIRALGYKDAFVVAFYNGKRISIDEARRMTGESPIASTQPTGTQTTGSEPTGTQTTGTEPTGTQNPEPGTQNPSTISSSPNAAKAVDVKELKGLFYTVQVGVYKNEVSKAKLKNLPDLVNERVNGFIRYSSGKYCTPEDAGNAKNNAVSKGITDAFVTAYYNGKRISVSEAKALEATGVVPCQGGTTPTSSSTQSSSTQPSSSQGSQQPAVGSQSSGSEPATTTQPTGTQTSGTEPSSSQGSQQPAVGSQSSGSEPATTTQPTGTQTSGTEPTTTGTQNPERGTPNISTLSTKPPVPETGLVFSVQIGAFRDEVPVEIANQFIKLSSKGVKNYLDQSSGLTVYQVGVCMTKEEAESFRSEAVAVGITDAFIVAFKDGKKITMEEAMELLGQ